MKKILLIATGGTIASKPTLEGLSPILTTDELLSNVDGIEKLCKVDSIQLYNLDSTNINYVHWLKIVETIENNYDKYDGFVVTHGTDTMAFTCAAMSYLIQGSKKPIVFTGSQKSIFMKDSDARNNLYNAFLYASSSKAHGVTLCFDNKIMSGTRCKKNRTKSYNAFTSINYPELARIRDQRIVQFITMDYYDKPRFYHELSTKVFVLKLIPGMDLKIFDYLNKHYDTIIIESFGVGGIPMYDEKDFSDALEELFLAGKDVVMTTQVPYEGSDLGLYQVGKKIKDKYEMLEAYDMTLEALVCKMMWIKGITNDKDEIKRLLYTPVQMDIAE